MRTYRYAPDSIDPLSRRIQRRQTVAFLIFTFAICAASFGTMNVRSALIFSSLFSLAVVLALFSFRSKGRQRIARWIRSVEVEIDDETISYRSRLGNKVIQRSSIVEACFSEKAIWLRGKTHRVRLQLPRELDDFHELQTSLQNWLPQHTTRSASRRSSAWAYVSIYVYWAVAALLLYVGMTSQRPRIAVPVCVVSAIGIAWYFAWCGRKIDERPWRLLLPITGYLIAAALLVRAVTLGLPGK